MEVLKLFNDFFDEVPLRTNETNLSNVPYVLAAR